MLPYVACNTKLTFKEGSARTVLSQASLDSWLGVDEKTREEFAKAEGAIMSYKKNTGFVETFIEVSTASELNAKVLEELKIEDPKEEENDEDKT